MSERKIKIQITLPKKLGDQIDQELLQNYTNKSLFFEKVLNIYFEQKNSFVRKKKIDLEI